MSLAPWRSPLARALHRNRSQPASRYLQLATIKENNQPANRTVVFRGFLENTDQLQFVVDTRSEKINQITHQPWGEACWYFTQTREQFRIAGQLILVQADHPDFTLQQARQTLWQNLSDSARIQFVWAAPGQPRAELAAFSPPAPNPEKALDNFCLLLLEPVQVDHLELRGEPQNRQIHYQELGQWSTQSVNP